MSLTSALRPAMLPLGGTLADRADPSQGVSFTHSTNYINLHRTLLRYQHLILLTPPPTSVSSLEPSDELSPLQAQIQAELYSPQPYHRTKWMRNIEGARTLLLALERQAKEIKVTRVRQQVARDLADKRALIKRLKARVEECGREVEAAEPQAQPKDESRRQQQQQRQQEGNLGHEETDTLYDILKAKGKLGDDTPAVVQEKVTRKEANPAASDDDQHRPDPTLSPLPGEQKTRTELFASSSSTTSTLRRRGGAAEPAPAAQTTGFSAAQATEQTLHASSREHEDLTLSLVAMAAQLKQQSRSLAFALDQDKGLLGRALEGLDANLSGIEGASKSMAFLRRMSEEEGWFGRLKLYAIIFGMWVVAILLVFVAPKLRF